MVQGDVHFGNLWGGRLGLAIHICKVLQPGCPWHRLESFLLKLAILWVHLTNIVQAPPSLSLSILYGRQVSTYGTTPRPQMTLWLSLCLVNSLDLPWVLLPRESWCWVIPHHSTVWLYLLPYKRLRRSTSEISKGNVLGHNHNLGSLTYGTSTAFLAVLWAALLSHFFRRNLRCGDEALYSQHPAHFGGLWQASHRLACCRRVIGSFLVLHVLNGWILHTNGRAVSLRD